MKKNTHGVHIMIHFIHTYTPKSVDTLLKSGLFKAGHGLKLMHKPDRTPPDDFNTAARKDGKLHALLEELACPFYVDRLQGGLGNTHTYPYDSSLLSHYAQSQTVDFLGLQMHEWASNFRSDQQRIAELCKKEGADPRTVHERPDLWEKIINGTLPLFLEAYTAEEWQHIALSASREEFLNACETLFARRMEQTNGLLFPTDSYFMAYRTALRHKVKLLLPEVGWQIPNMRLQIAYTRGMAKSADIAWGIYYECWYCNEKGQFSVPYSLTDDKDDWLESFGEEGFGNHLPFARREHGGSSLNLAERAWVYAYFSGAKYMGEEYGICNTLRSVGDTQLSPYGETKKRFIDLTECYEPTGTVYTPFAAVLPAEMEILDERLREEYLDYPPDEEPSVFSRAAMQTFIANAESLFGTSGKHGNMGHTLRNSRFPDIADLIHEDMTADLEKYEYLIDLTGKPDLADSRRNVLTPAQAHEKAKELLPVCVTQNLHCTYRTDGSVWQILIMNNDGVYHEPFSPDEILPEAAVRAQLQLKDERTQVKKLCGTGTLTTQDGNLFVSLSGGAWIILQAENE